MTPTPAHAVAHAPRRWRAKPLARRGSGRRRCPHERNHSSTRSGWRPEDRYYLDQREKLLAGLATRTGHALDCFTSAALCIAYGGEVRIGAKPPTVARGAWRWTGKTRQSNNAANVGRKKFRQAVPSSYWRDMMLNGAKFAKGVLDTPALQVPAKNLTEPSGGTRKSIAALNLLEPGGLLITCLLLAHVSEAALIELVAEASLDASRTVRVMERRTQAQDHPIILTVPEIITSSA